MLGVYVHVPIACFRKGMAREYLETEAIPPPATCYGFLLSLVGETDRLQHVGVRVAPQLLTQPDLSVVLRTVWRVKSKPLGSGGNTRPDYQQLLTDIGLVMWLDSSQEPTDRTNKLEDRVRHALDPTQRHSIDRFGGLSLGESTHLVNEVLLVEQLQSQGDEDQLLTNGGRLFQVDDRGRLTLPVWVDHVGSQGTRYATGNLVSQPVSAPAKEKMPLISPV